jgi:hypothetical protein
MMSVPHGEAEGTEMFGGAPSWLVFLIAILVILAILYLIGMRVNVG